MRAGLFVFMKKLFVRSTDKTLKTSGHCTALEGDFLEAKISGLSEHYFDHITYERNFSSETVIKYRDCLRCFVRSVGDVRVVDLNTTHFLALRKKLAHRNISESRVAGVIFAMKSFLRYCRESLEIDCVDTTKIKVPRPPRHDVVFLTNDEIDKFIKTIRIYNKWDGKTKRKNINIQGLRFRTLVEVLLGTGMRISETLALNTTDVDFGKGEVVIVGKGNKQRTIFFSKRCLSWLQKYLAIRSDNCEALFVTHPKGTRLKRTDIWRFFQRHSELAGIKKKVTPHILRHTMASNLIHNGCDLVTIKELLGHHDIGVTVKSYIGIDKRKIQENHAKFLNYSSSPTSL